MHLLNNKLNLSIKLLISALPISILIGPSVSLINIITLSLFGITIFILLNKENSLFKNQTIRLLFFLYLYLIFNTIISINYEGSFKRNFGFIRYIFLFIAINYIFYVDKYNKFFLKVWTLVLLVVFFDIFYEFYNNKNILGFQSLPRRIVSFFKDEAIIGSFVNGFIFILIGFLFKNYKKKNFFNNFFIFSFLFIGITCVILSGERANTIKLILGITLFFFIIKKSKYIYLITILSSIIILLSVNFGQFKTLKTRFYDDIFPRLFNKEIRENYLYFQLQASGYQVFKTYPVFGVGNKNYRIETCKTTDAAPIINNFNKTYRCNTHPHQVYIEFLSEHGLVGSIILIFLLFSLIFKNFKKIIQDQNLIQIGCFCFLLTNFIPIIPGGSFFSDYSSVFFFINLSFLYAVNSKTNIFKKVDNF